MGLCNNTFIKHHLEITKSIYEKLLVGISIYDSIGNFVYVNNKAVEIFGVKDIKNLFGVNIFSEPNTPKWVLDKIKNGEETEYELLLDFKTIAKYHPTNILGTKSLLFKIAILRDASGEVQGYINICEDVTLKKQNEEALVEIHLKLARLMDFMISGIEIYDKNGVLIDCNDYELQIFGLDKKEDLLNKNITLFNNPNMPIGFKEGLLNKEDVKFEFEYDFALVNENHYFKTSKKEKIYLEVKGAPIFSNSNDVIGYIVEANDITENKRQELQLKELHQNLQLALSAGQVSAWTYDIDNKYFKSMFGNAIVGDGCTYNELETIIHPDDREMMRDFFEKIIINKKRSEGFIVRIYDKKHGDYRFYESDMEIRTNTDGKIKDIIGTQRDVTDKCIKQLELDNSRKSLDLIMESSNFLAWDYDIHSDKYHILYGDRLIQKHKELIKFKEHISPSDLSKINKLMQDISEKLIEKGNKDIRLKNDNNTDCFFEISISGVTNPNGSVVGFVGSLYDITKRNEQMLSLEEQNKKNKLIYEVCNIVPWDYNPYTHILHSNASAPMFGIEEINVKTELNDFISFIHHDDRAKIIALIEDLDTLKLDTIHTNINVLDSTKNKYIHLAAEGVAIRDAKGNILKYSGINRNMDEWIRLNKTINEQNFTHNIVLDNVNSLLIYSDINGDIKWNNAKSYSNLISKMGIDSLIHDKECNYMQGDYCQKYNSCCIVKEAIKTKQIVTKELQTDDNYAHIAVIPILGTDKEVKGVLYKIDDITESQRIKNELIKTKNRAEIANQFLKEIIDKVPCALYIKDYEELRMVIVNKLFCNYLNLPEDKIIGKTDYDLFNKTTANLHIKKDKLVIENSKLITYDEDIDTLEGKRYLRIIKSSINM